MESNPVREYPEDTDPVKSTFCQTCGGFMYSRYVGGPHPPIRDCHANTRKCLDELRQRICSLEMTVNSD